jgi:hypothetical protein
MAQTGFTPILIYSSSTATNAPAVGNLTNSTLGSELAINITDGKLFYKDNANAIQVIGWKTTPTSAGGTGLTSYTAGDLLYYATGTALSKLAIGASGRYLSSTGSAPQWSAPAALTETDDTNVTLTLGGNPSTALLNAVSMTLGWTGTLAASRGGTNLSSFTGNGVVYASSTSQLATGTNVVYNGSTFAVLSKASYFDPQFTGAGGAGLNIQSAYSYNDGNANSIGAALYQNAFNIIHVSTSAGFSSIPVFSNGGNGVAYGFSYFDPDNATWGYSAASPTITFTQAGTGGNTFSIVLNSNNGNATIQRTAGSQAYVVCVQRLAA